MTHTQWFARLRKNLAMVEREPARAIKSLEKLLVAIEAESKKSVAEWHVAQTL